MIIMTVGGIFMIFFSGILNNFVYLVEKYNKNKVWHMKTLSLSGVYIFNGKRQIILCQQSVNRNNVKRYIGNCWKFYET